MSFLQQKVFRLERSFVCWWWPVKLHHGNEVVDDIGGSDTSNVGYIISCQPNVKREDFCCPPLS
jgi:hypothetical protein